MATKTPQQLSPSPCSRPPACLPAEVREGLSMTPARLPYALYFHALAQQDSPHLHENQGAGGRRSSSGCSWRQHWQSAPTACALTRSTGRW